MPKSKNSFYVAFPFVGKHLHIKFQKILLNGLDFANFLHFRSIFVVFWPIKGPQMLKSENNFFVKFSYVEKHLYTKFQKISPNNLDFANFLNFWLFFWPKDDDIEK